MDRDDGGRNEPSWKKFIESRMHGEEQNVPWRVLDKLICHDFCQDNDLPIAQLLGVYDAPASIRLEDLPEEFVLKPNLESSMRGVMVLRKIGESYWEALKRKRYAAADIVSLQASFFDGIRGTHKKIIAEETVHDLAGNSIPIDYKAYAFFGRLALVLEIDRNTSPSSVAWYDGCFNPLQEGLISNSPKYVQSKLHRRPRCWPELLDLARRASVALDTPFVSVDMYASRLGALVGEFTLTPGGLYYGDHFVLSEQQDNLMGEMWQEAALRIFEKPGRAE